ncbi:response regulator transcription factor [Mesonia sp. K7]|uniref:response regulator transcription factor n=1 Tax=Mesonia sp. K7 TaxID=2218606 RepID=UPI000DA7CFE4|nr:response regulator transcription factor [Mesonia sp. K7]PZD79215.1 DNA-binding response regulator [Mesonia sp. K7]
MKRILLAEDDHDLGVSLKNYLVLHGFEVFWAKDGEEAYRQFLVKTYDIGVLDVMMPKMDGFTLAKKISKQQPMIPFIFLTAKNEKESKIEGLKLGADDYIVKPFDVEELVLRLHNIIKRTTQQKSLQISSHIPAEHIVLGSYTFMPHQLELQSPTQTYKLTQKETDLIYFLYLHKNSLIPREEILQKNWNKTDFFTGRSMDVFISRIRKYFKEDQSIAINSIRGIGLEFIVE